jgi:hypothetical protein
VRSTHPIRPPPEPDSKLLREISVATKLSYLPVLSFMILTSADRYGVGVQWSCSSIFLWSCLAFSTALLEVVSDRIFGPSKLRSQHAPRLSRLCNIFDMLMIPYGLYRGGCNFMHDILEWSVYAVWILCHAFFYSSVVCSGLAVASWLQWCSVWLLDSSSGFDISNANMLVFPSFSFGLTCLWCLIKLPVFMLWDLPVAIKECISSSDLSDLNHDIATILSRLDWSLDEDNPNDASSLTTVSAPTPPVHRVTWFKSKVYRFRRFMHQFIGEFICTVSEFRRGLLLHTR